VCPAETTRYAWRIVALDDSEQTREVEVEVLPASVIRHLVSQDAETTHYYDDLASNWEANGDASTWTFQLRTAVTMDDGRPFTADVVRETLDANRHAISSYDEVVVIDDFTVMVELTGPNPNLIPQIALVDFVVQPCPEAHDPECHPAY
jgi:peptide/nickel transport system substrate-binding protein